MKKMLFSILALLTLSLTSAYAETPEFTIEVGQPLGSPRFAVLNVVDKDWFIGLEDESYWQVMPLKNKPKRSWHEWWNNITPKEWVLDDSFFFDPRSWEHPLLIQVYEANNSLYPGYRYVLENVATGQRAFAELVAEDSGHTPTLEAASKYFENPKGDQQPLARNQHFLRGIVVLKNDSIWRDLRTDERARAWQQWWKDVRTADADSSFVFELSGWMPGDDIQVYAHDSEESLTSSKYGQIDKHVYLLQNKTRDQLAYAVSVTLMEYSDACERYALDTSAKSYKEGFNDGHTSGHLVGYGEGYTSGYTAGQTAGYSAGFSAGTSASVPQEQE